MIRLVLRFLLRFLGTVTEAVVSFMIAVVIVVYYFFGDESNVPDLLIMTAMLTLYLIVLFVCMDSIARDFIEEVRSERKRRKIILCKNDSARRMVVCYNTNTPMISSKKIFDQKRQANIKVSCR